jgi:hypothetical protein
MARNVLKARITQGASPSRDAFSLPTIIRSLISGQPAQQTFAAIAEVQLVT